MEIIIVAIVGAIGSIILSLLGLYAARKAGIGVTQDKLVANLQGLVASLEQITAEQNTKINRQSQQISELVIKVDELKRLTIEQAILINKLLSRRKIILNHDDDDNVSR